MTRSRSAADQLDDALDDAMAGDSTRLAQHDPAAAATWELLADWTALGGLEGLDPASADPWLLDEDVIHTYERHAIMPHTLTMPQPIPTPLPQSRPTRRSPMSVTWTALAWLLIVAIGGGAIWGLWPLLNDREPTPTPLAAFQPELTDATPEFTPEIDPNLVANWAGEGNSWNLSDESAILGDPTILATLGGEGELLTSMPLVVGDSVYFSLSGPNGTSEDGRTIRYDLGEREVVWESQIVLVGYLTSDGSLLSGRAQLENDPVSGESYVPVSIALDSGHLVGASYIGLESTNSLYSSAPYSSPGLSFWIDSQGVVLATTQNAPDAMFKYAKDWSLASVYNDLERGWTGNHQWLGLVVGEDYVYSVRPSMTVVQYDRISGQELRTFNLVDAVLKNLDGAHLQLFDGRLIVTATIQHDPTSSVQPAVVVILNAETLEPLAAGNVPDLQSNPVDARDWVYVAARLNNEPKARIYRVHPVSGTLGAPISEFETQPRGGLSMVMAGETLLVLDNGTNSIVAIDPAANTVIETINLPPFGSSLGARGYMGYVQLWNNHPVLVRGDGTIIVVGLED